MGRVERHGLDLSDFSLVLKAMADPTRLRLLKLCAESDLTVSELTRILGHSQPRVSRHLKLLVDCGLLERHPEGAWVFYRLADVGSGADIGQAIVQRLPDYDAMLYQDQEQLREIKALRRSQASSYFASVATQWDERRKLHGAEAEIEAVVESLVQPLDVACLVDIGTGTGRLLSLCAPYIDRGIGIDLSHDMLQVARSNLDQEGIRHCTVRHGDMYRVAMETGTVDVVVIHQVLHYADNPRAVLQEAARLLKDQGVIIVVDFAPHTQEHLRDQHQHRRLGFSDEEVHHWLAETGFVDVQSPKVAGAQLTAVVWSGHRRIEQESSR